MNNVEIIRNLCKNRGLSLSKLERELGIGNGTISKSTSNYMRSDRLKAIADYFHVSMEYLMTGEEGEQLPRFSPEEEALIMAYRRADEGIQESVCKLLDIKRVSILSEEVG